jgi:hypothetical protein
MLASVTPSACALAPAIRITRRRAVPRRREENVL